LRQKEESMSDDAEYTNRCACGWEVRGSEDEVVEATIDHGRRIHNMEATRDEVLAALHADPAGDGAIRDDRQSA
jgi:predicted small metal-binding protein